MSQTPRHINTSRSLNRPDPAAAAPRHAASSTDAKQSTGGAHNEPPRRPAQGAGQKPPRRRKKKKKMPLWLPFAVVMAIIAVISGVVVYGVSLVNKVEDSIRPDDSTPTIEEEVKTAEEYKGDVVNILVCGIDYEEGRNYSNDPTSNDGMTDMILYVQFDIKNGALRMLQIPRNSLVTTKNKKITLSNGKTYAATNYQINSVAISNGGSIAALADVIYDQFRLPIDYYVTVDMQALVDMVDNFGGIEVYIPHDMSYGGSKLLKGYRNLNGASAEFFVRCRHGDGYANSAALFLCRPVQACPRHGRYRYPEPAAAGVQKLYQDGYGHFHHCKAGGVFPQARQLQHHSGADTGVHGRAQRGQDRHLCRLLLRGAGCGFHCKPAQPVFLHLHRPH